MPLSKKRDRERKRAQRRIGVKAIMSSADVRAMHLAGIDPEYIEEETGKVSSRLFYALMRDRDAARAHLGWIHDAKVREEDEMSKAFDNYELRHGLRREN